MATPKKTALLTASALAIAAGGTFYALRRPTGGAKRIDAAVSSDAGADAGVDAGALPDAGTFAGLGTNLTGIADYSPEYAFIDAFKMSRSWVSGTTIQWDDGRAIAVDAYGNVVSLLPGQIARTLLFWDIPGTFPVGDYTLIWEGDGSGIEVWANGNVVAATSTSKTLRVSNNVGIGINITSLNPTDPLRNIRLFMPGHDPTSAVAVFHPDFRASISRYSVLRFMDWMDTNNSQISSWADRPRSADVRYSVKGVPIEVMVMLANETGKVPWFTMPHLASDDYIRSFAGYVRDNLRSDLPIYVEYSNEVWNPLFQQHAYAREQGKALGLDTTDFGAAIKFYSRRSKQVFIIWESVFGSNTRLRRVVSSQAPNIWVSQTILDFEFLYQKADMLAIAPYFGYQFGDAENAARVKTMTLDAFMAELEADAVAKATDWTKAQKTVAATRNLWLIAYEGGQSLVGQLALINDTELNAKFDAANHHPRMREIYLAYLNAWTANGGGLFVHFVNCSKSTKFGRWGALEYFAQPRLQAPKFDALQFVAER